MKKYLCVALACLLVSSLTGCGSSVDSSALLEEPTAFAETEESVPQDGSNSDDVDTDLEADPALMLVQLVEAYNEQNINEILECFDPESMQAVSGVVQLLGAESKMFQNILASVLADVESYNDNYWGTAVTLTPIDYTVSGSTGELSYYIEWEDGNSFEKTIPVTLVDGTWYLAPEHLDYTTPEYDCIPVSVGITEEDVAEGLYSYYEYVDGKKCYGFMNISGKTIIEPYFSDVGVFSEDGRCPVCMDRKWGIIDKLGNLVVAFEFDEIKSNPSEGFWTCYLNGSGYGFLNPDAGSGITCQYSACGIFSDGVVPVQKDGYWGAINTEGNMTVEFLYDEMSHWQIPFTYEEYELSFINRLIPVMVNGARGVIDSSGNYILPMDKEHYIPRKTGSSFFACNNDSSHPYTTIYALDGTEILDTKLGECTGYINDTMFLDGWGNVYGFDQQGNVIFDVNKDIFPSLNISPHASWSTAPDSQMRIDRYFAGIEATVTGFGFDDWQLLEIYTGKTTTSYAYNLINASGEVFFDSWYDWIMHSDQYIAGYNEDSDTTYLYNYNGELLNQYDGKYCNFVSDYFLVNSEKKQMINLLTGDVEEYSKINLLDSNDSAVIVFDGVFYGLYTKDGLVGNGITYNEISYDSGTRICTMELGATTERYRLGIDGTANIIE